jgi:hypothetical protein
VGRRVFVACAHAERNWKDRVVQHLGVLGTLDVWDDRRIAALLARVRVIPVIVRSCAWREVETAAKAW